MRIRSCIYFLSTGLLLAVLMILSGCKEPGTIGRFRATPVTNVILKDLGVVDEDPDIFAEARDPTARDLQVEEIEYIIQPGDIVDISIYELFVDGQEYGVRRQVNETGRITLPEIGTFRVAGQTETELTETIINRLSPRYIKDPTVNVIVSMPTKKVYSLSGAIQMPGPYQLGLGDFRIAQALAQAGGIPQTSADYAYVIRNVRAEEVELPEETESSTAAPGKRPVTQRPGIQAEQDRAETKPQEQVTEKEVSPEPGREEQKSPQQEQKELLESVIPLTDIILPVEIGDPADILEEVDPQDQAKHEGDAAEQDKLRDTKFGTLQSEPSGLSIEKPLKVIREGNRFLLIPAEGEAVREPSLPKEPMEPVEPSEPVFEWEKGEFRQPQAPGKQLQYTEATEGQIKEVIRIDLKKLRGGDYTQNITIRAGDDIQIPFNATGIFSVMGQVGRPGVYSLTGQRLTLKQAIAAAGPLTPLASPSRCEIIRRIGENREVTYRVNLEKLFAGTSPDIFLKPNDIINVGSHPLMRFIAVIRQSFRTTYGFGFVYDRNFSDKDFGH